MNRRQAIKATLATVTTVAASGARRLAPHAAGSEAAKIGAGLFTK